MGMKDVRDKAAIVGVGHNSYDRNPDSIELGTLASAFRNALEDAGLTHTDLDGIIANSVPPEGCMDRLPELLGLGNVRYAFQSWGHGRINATVLSVAALATFAGMADYIACFSCFSLAGARVSFQGPRTGFNPEVMREGGGPHLETPAYGNVSTTGGVAMAMQKYLMRYGYTSEDLGVVSVTQRRWASLNPGAFLRNHPMTLDDYLQSRYIIEPMRLPDNAIPVNFAVCAIVTTAERARDCRKKPVYISGMQAANSGNETFVFGRSHLGVARQTEGPYKAPGDQTVYRMSGLSVEDVNVVGIFDTSSPLVPFALEEFGYCKEGEALAWMKGGRSGPGGDLPVNTHGGSLSEGMTGGNGAVVELVRQLRGEAGARQVPGAEVAQYLMCDRSSLMLRR